MENNESYIKAAKIIASCPKSRLPIVLEILKKGGLDFTEEEIPNISASSSQLRSPSVLKLKRSNQNHPNWKPTSNPHIVKLREAYNEGISLTELGRRVHLHKTTLYQYLYGNSEPDRFVADEIVYAIFDMLPYLDPRNKN